MSGGLRQRCGSCGFWQRYVTMGDEESHRGLCRYAPPVNDANGVGQWPDTHETDSCGKGLPARFPERFEGRDQRDVNVRD